jgi:chromo domain-containing protein 1
MATVPNDDSLFEGDYDTDSISLTSTVASDYSETALYDVEKIISEDTMQDDEGSVISKYLIKWLNYPLHK